MKKLATNVYMGKNSIAKIPKQGKVDTLYEIMLNTYATAYDALNLVLLDNDYGLIVNERKFKSVPYAQWDSIMHTLSLFKVVSDASFTATLNGRFNVLRNLSRKYLSKKEQSYALNKIEQIEKLTLLLVKRYPAVDDSILKNEFADILSFQDMYVVDNLVNDAELRLVKAAASGKLKLVR